MFFAVNAVWNTKLLRHSAPHSSWTKCLRWPGSCSPHGVFTVRNRLEFLKASSVLAKSLCVGCIYDPIFLRTAILSYNLKDHRKVRLFASPNVPAALALET